MNYEEAAMKHVEDAITRILGDDLDPLYGTTRSFGSLTRAQVDEIVEEAAVWQHRLDTADFDRDVDAHHYRGYLAGIARTMRLLTGVERFHVVSPVTGWEGDVDWQSIFRMKYVLEEANRANEQ